MNFIYALLLAINVQLYVIICILIRTRRSS